MDKGTRFVVENFGVYSRVFSLDLSHKEVGNFMSTSVNFTFVGEILKVDDIYATDGKEFTSFELAACYLVR